MLDTSPSIVEGRARELERFREQWREEVRQKKAGGTALAPSAPALDSLTGAAKNASHVSPTAPIGSDRKGGSASAVVRAPLPSLPPATGRAVELYRTAVEYEQQGLLDDALALYKRSFKLDSNVDRAYHRTFSDEARVASSHTQASVPGGSVAAVESLSRSSNIQQEVDVRMPDSLEHILASMASRPLAFLAENEQQPSPLQSLPDEIVVHILLELASRKDISSIESFASISLKARLLTTDASLWRTVCRLTFLPPQIRSGRSIESLASMYGADYRTTFVKHPHVRLDGVYIAVCHYVRPGQSENAWVTISHLITYHRYLRFFPDGRVISLLANEEQSPAEVVHLLKTTTRLQGLQIGSWKLDDASPTVIIRALVDPGRVTPKYEFAMDLTLSCSKRGRLWNKMELDLYASVNLESGELQEFAIKKERPFYFSKTEHRNQEGRTYWYNNDTKQSVWEKPDALKTPFERALAKTPWKEYVANGRKYWYNTESKQSKWDMPEDLTLVLAEVEKEFPGQAHVAPKPIIPSQIQSGASTVPLPSLSPSAPGTSVAQFASSNGGQLVTASSFVPATRPSVALPISTNTPLPSRPNLPPDPVIPQGGFATTEEAEKAFMHLLRKAGIDASWTWDQTMRAVITDPLYKALKSLAEKKAAWQKYVEDLKVKEAEEKEARLQRSRPAFRSLLSNNNNVQYYTRFRSAEKIFAGHPTWMQVKSEAERRLLFDEYVSSLQEKQTAATREMRTRNISKVVALLKDLDVTVTTRWRVAQAQVLHSAQWADDPELRQLAPLDMLLAFEDYSRVLERDYEEVHRKNQIERTRQERKARESFRTLLEELRREGKLRARTKWKVIYPLVADDPRYLNMLGNPGSNPLELFWDIVDELDAELEALVAPLERAFATTSFTFGPETSKLDFHNALQGERSLMPMSSDQEHDVFEHLRQRALRRQADERRRAERKLRHMQDDLRYALKKLDPPIDIEAQYDDVLPRIRNLEEYKALNDEDSTRAAFAKFIKRQKEKLRERSEDGGSNTSRRRRDSHANGKARREHDVDQERERTSRTARPDEDKSSSRREYRDSGREKRHEKDREQVDYEKGHRTSRHREERKSSKRPMLDEERERGREAQSWEEPYPTEYSNRRSSRTERDPDDVEASDERVRKRARLEGRSPMVPRGDSPEEGEI